MIILGKIAKTAYPNLNREMREKRYTITSLIARTNFNYNTMLSKLRSGRKVTVDEALEIKRVLESDQAIEVLFAKVG